MEENFNTVESMDLDIEKQESTLFSKFPFSKKTIIIAGAALLVLILLIIIIASAASGKKSNKNKDNGNSEENKDKEDKGDKEEPFCLIGDEEQCLTCNKSECGSCNSKYTLINGECVPDFSIRANYISYSDNEYVELLNYTFSDYITEMIVDEEKVSPSSIIIYSKQVEITLYI